MAKVYVAGFRTLARDRNGRQEEVVLQPPLYETVLDTGSGEAHSANMPDAVTVIRVHSDGDVQLSVGPGKRAGVSSWRLTTGQTEYLGIVPGVGARVSAITTGSAILNNPLVALLGPSTTHRNLVESGHTLYALTSGPHNWSHAISPRFRHLNYYNASDTLGRNFTGNNYGLDSDPISNQVTRIAAIKASNAGIVIWNSGRGAVGDFVAGQTVAGYCDPVKAGLLDLATSGKVIIWENLWPRHTLAGGIWASGGEGRSLLLQVNAHMAAWCFDNGITVADVWSIMVDQTDPDLNPKANYYTSDGIHYAAAGAYQVGVYYAGLMAALCAAPSTYDHTEVANIAPSATMTGTAGDATGNGASGTAPDNWTVSRGSVGNARSLTASIESIGGANYVVLTLGSSGTVAAAGEGGTLRPTTTPTLALLTVNNWYQARCTLICDNWAGWSGFKLLVSDNNGTVNGAAALTPGSGAGGETPVTGFTGSNQYAVRPDARTLILTSMPFKAGATGCTIRFNFNYVNASGGAVIKVGKFDLRQVSDPATII